MNTERTLKHLFVICSSFGLLLCALLLLGNSNGIAPVFLYSLLLPLGIVCPLISAGCLLHERWTIKKPLAALAVRLAGLGMFWSTVAFFIRKHWA